MSEIALTSAGHFAASFLGRLVIIVINADEIADSEGIEHCENLVPLVEKHGPARGVLLYAVKAAPSSRQRGMLIDLYENRLRQKEAERVAILSNSAAVRLGYNAIGLLLRMSRQHMRMFAPPDFGDALAWVAEGVPFDREEAKTTFLRMLELTRVDKRSIANDWRHIKS